jgi:RimJ/RimL family protein N-acetyltransferase
MGGDQPNNDLGRYRRHYIAGGAAGLVYLRPMDTQPLAKSYLARSMRIGIRPWHRRHDRKQIDRWPPYSPALPLHWTAAPPADGACLSYAVDLLALEPEDRLIGRISSRPVAGTARRIGIVLHPDRLGQGFGTEALHLLGQIDMGLTQLLLDVAASNDRAIRCYQRAGFVQVGESWRGGFRYLSMARSV